MPISVLVRHFVIAVDRYIMTLAPRIAKYERTVSVRRHSYIGCEE